MRHAFPGWISLALLVASAAHAQGGAPLDVSDPTPRSVFVQIEGSSSLGGVGQTFGPAFPATWSGSGNTGTLTISAATHEQIRGSGQAVPGSFTPIVFQIDLTTLQATSQPASGALSSGQVSSSFTQQALGTTTTAGYMGPSVPPLFCTSQADVDYFCMYVPSFCGQTCTIVPGHVYDPGTGKINLVGRETQSGCDGIYCQGPFDFFTARGDLRLTEAHVGPLIRQSGKFRHPTERSPMASIATKRRSGWLVALYLVMSTLVGLSICALTGCERKEKVIDVETPGADVEVERNIDTGEVDVNVERDR